MTEAITEEAETSAIEQLFLTMLEREHWCTTVQQRSLSIGQSADSQEIGMPFARDVTVDASFIQLAGVATMASAFGGLIYKILISRLQLVAAITVFAISLVSHLVTDTGTVHQGDLQVLCRYL